MDPALAEPRRLGAVCPSLTLGHSAPAQTRFLQVERSSLMRYLALCREDNQRLTAVRAVLRHLDSDYQR